MQEAERQPTSFLPRWVANIRLVQPRASAVVAICHVNIQHEAVGAPSKQRLPRSPDWQERSRCAAWNHEVNRDGFRLQGQFFEPTVLADVTEEMLIAQEAWGYVCSLSFLSANQGAGDVLSWLGMASNHMSRTSRFQYIVTVQMNNTIPQCTSAVSAHESMKCPRQLLLWEMIQPPDRQTDR